MSPKNVHRFVASTWILSCITLFGVSNTTYTLSELAQNLWAIFGWTIWAVTVFLILVPSTVGLVIVRTITPLAAGLAFVGFFGDSISTQYAIGFAFLVISVAVIFSAEFGHVCVNASAYGNETRFLLRPPVQYLIPVGIAWALITTPIVLTLTSVADAAWIQLIIAAVFAIVLAPLMTMRLGKLASRWLVIVPAGLVIHDKVVLAETVMFRTHSVTEILLAPANSESADLTGVTWGVPIQVGIGSGDKVILAPDRANPGGRAIHVYSLLVAPSRPGMFLKAWRR